MQFIVRTFRRRTGITMIMAMFTMVALIGFASFAVDLGHVRLVKAELQNAADAAALHAAQKLADGVAAVQAAAADAADDNTSDLNPITLNVAEDVLFGTWNASTRAFTALPAGSEGSANAIKVIARRTAARGNAVQLILVTLLGRNTLDVTASAIAYRASGNGYALFADELLNFNNGTILVDSYDAELGSHNPATAGSQGHVGSNDYINVSSYTTIKGNADRGPSGLINNNGTITGTISKMAQAYALDPIDAGSAASVNNNSNIAAMYWTSGGLRLENGEHLSLPGGTYYLASLYIRPLASLTFTGPATIYITGNSNVYGPIATAQNKPANLKFRLLSPAGIFTVDPVGSLYMDLYGPGAYIDLDGPQEIHGRIYAESINTYGGLNFHHDTSLNAAGPGTVIRLVK